MDMIVASNGGDQRNSACIGELPTTRWPTTIEKLMEAKTGGLLRLLTGEIVACRFITDCGNGYLHLHLPKVVYPRHFANNLWLRVDGMEVRRDAIVWVADEGVYAPECFE